MVDRAGRDKPVPPLNLVGDFGGGGMLLAFGMVAALLEASRSGEGQVVDAAMVDGAASLMTIIHAFRRNGLWNDERGTNILDTGAPFYEVYETADEQWMAVGGIEGQFYVELIRGLGLEGDASLPGQMARDEWPSMKERFAAVFRTKTRDEWTAVFAGTDACVVPVLSPWEAHLHPHNVARSTFVEVDGARAAGTGAALLADAVCDFLAAVAAGGRHGVGAGRVGRGRRRGRQAAEVGGAELS